MSSESSGGGPVVQAAPPRGPRRPPPAILDHDRGFMQVLANRLDALGWEHRALGTPVMPEALVTMRLNAVVLDIALIGPGAWEYIERICTRLPGLAVIVCTGPSSVDQRVRGLRLGGDAWVIKPGHAEELICAVGGL